MLKPVRRDIIVWDACAGFMVKRTVISVSLRRMATRSMIRVWVAAGAGCEVPCQTVSLCLTGYKRGFETMQAASCWIGGRRA